MKIELKGKMLSFDHQYNYDNRGHEYEIEHLHNFFFGEDEEQFYKITGILIYQDMNCYKVNFHITRGLHDIGDIVYELHPDKCEEIKDELVREFQKDIAELAA